MSRRILILDVSGVLHAVKFSLAKHRLSHNELPTFVIYGFLLKLQFLLRKTRADVVVYATDSITSKRKEIYSIYKEKRQQNKTEQQIALDKIAYPQFEAVVDYVIPTIGYRNIFGSDGLEADDIIGRVCKTYKNDELVICSSDQDMYQLLNDNCCMFNVKTNSWYTNTDFIRDYAIEPKMWKRVKSIAGCTSDNVKGVPGVGEKTAIKFINGTLPITHKTYQGIISKSGKKIINRNKSLVILPFKGTPEFAIKPDHPSVSGLKKVCDKYGFKSILSDIKSWRQSLRLT